MKPRRWTEKLLRKAAKQSRSVRQVLRHLGLQPAGGNYVQIQKYIREYHISTKHFTGKVWNKGLRGIGKPRIKLEDILVSDSSYQSFKLKKRLFNSRLKEPKCELCGWAKKAKDGRIPLELDHINGSSRDNRFHNLRILCPNCHSLQTTHRGLNIRRVTDEVQKQSPGPS